MNFHKSYIGRSAPAIPYRTTSCRRGYRHPVTAMTNVISYSGFCKADMLIKTVREFGGCAKRELWLQCSADRWAVSNRGAANETRVVGRRRRRAATGRRVRPLIAERLPGISSSSSCPGRRRPTHGCAGRVASRCRQPTARTWMSNQWRASKTTGEVSSVRRENKNSSTGRPSSQSSRRSSVAPLFYNFRAKQLLADSSSFSEGMSHYTSLAIRRRFSHYFDDHKYRSSVATLYGWPGGGAVSLTENLPPVALPIHPHVLLK